MRLYLCCLCSGKATDNPFALDADKQKERENIAAANLENQALEDEYNKAQSDEEYIEQAIRKNLGFVKPNERVFIDISRSH